MIWVSLNCDKNMQINTSDTTFNLDENETLLEGLERTGHQVESQCRGGYCGACRLKVRSGSVSYAQTPLAFVAHDEILPCCCKVNEPLVLEVAFKKEVDTVQQDMFHPTLFDEMDNSLI